MTHDTRRTYLSAAERLECPYYVLKRLAGHKVSSDTLVPYIVVSMERLRAHAEKDLPALLGFDPRACCCELSAPIRISNQARAPRMNG